MMKFRTACLVVLLSFSLSAWIEAGKGNGNGNGGGGGGGGGKKSDSSTYAAEFLIVDDNQHLVSDGGGLYSDQVLDVSAEIVGSGNPLLKLGNSQRVASVDLNECIATEGNSLPQPYANILGISPYGMSVDGNFLGMTTGQVADTLLGIGLESPDDGTAWGSLRFDPYFGSDLAEVERLSESSWEVRSLDRKAAIVRPTNKGNRKEVVATCTPFRLTYTVHCKEIDTNGVCLPK